MSWFRSNYSPAVFWFINSASVILRSCKIFCRLCCLFYVRKVFFSNLRKMNHYIIIILLFYKSNALWNSLFILCLILWCYRKFSVNPFCSLLRVCKYLWRNFESYYDYNVELPTLLQTTSRDAGTLNFRNFSELVSITFLVRPTCLQSIHYSLYCLCDYHNISDDPFNGHL